MALVYLKKRDFFYFRKKKRDYVNLLGYTVCLHPLLKKKQREFFNSRTVESLSADME